VKGLIGKRGIVPSEKKGKGGEKKKREGRYLMRCSKGGGKSNETGKTKGEGAID